MNMSIQIPIPRRWLIGAWTFVLCFGQQTELQFERINLEHGLSQSTVFDICQDDEGYLWLGTANGLNRYDGYGIKTFHHYPDDGDNLSSDWIQTLWVDRNGTLWVGTRLGLNRYEPRGERFETLGLNQLVHPTVMSIAESEVDQLWIGTLRGLYRLDTKRLEFQRIEGELISGPIRAICADPGELWVGTDHGLIHLNANGVRLDHFRFDPNSSVGLANRVVQSLLRDSLGQLWIGTSRGLTRLNAEGTKTRHFIHNRHPAAQLYSSEVESVLDELMPRNALDSLLDVGPVADLTSSFQIDRKQRVLVVVQGEMVNEPYDYGWIEQQGRVVWEPDISMTRHGGGSLKNRIQVQPLWLNPGEYQLRYTSDETHHWGAWNDLAPDRQDLWGISVYKMGDGRLEPEALMLKRRPYSIIGALVESIVEDRSGQIWIGSNDGLSVYDPETARFANYRHNPSNVHSLSQNAIHRIYEDRSGIVWVGTNLGGLNKLNQRRTQFKHIAFNPYDQFGLRNRLIYAFEEDRWGNIWVGTGDGVNVLVDGSVKRFSYHETHLGAIRGGVMSICSDRAGDLWIGCNGNGVYLLRLSQVDEVMKGISKQSPDLIKRFVPSAEPGTLDSAHIRQIYEDL